MHTYCRPPDACPACLSGRDDLPTLFAVVARSADGNGLAVLGFGGTIGRAKRDAEVNAGDALPWLDCDPLCLSGLCPAPSAVALVEASDRLCDRAQGLTAAAFVWRHSADGRGYADSP